MPLLRPHVLKQFDHFLEGSWEVPGSLGFRLKAVAPRGWEKDSRRPKNWIKATGMGRQKEGHFFASKYLFTAKYLLAPGSLFSPN